MAQAIDKADVISTIWTEYENGRAFLTSKGLTVNIPKYVGFYEGWGHWAKPTEATKHMPRPVFNFVKMIIDNKVSNIVGSPVKINYVADNDKIATRKFTRFAHFILKEMGMENLDYEAILTDRKKGTFIKHYYWSEEAIGRKGKFEGGLRCELIDPLNIVLSDPNEKDIQKQKWIMFPTRVGINKAKDMCDKAKYKKLIAPDELETDYPNKKELEGSELVTVLTKYFKKDGEVYYQKATKTTILHDPIPVNPYLIKMKNKNQEIDDKGDTTPDELLEPVDRTWREDYYMATLYPIEMVSLDPSDDCMWGISEVANMMVVQKLVNFNVGMGALNIQNLGAPKTVVKPNALQGQVLTNEPGQVVIDYTPGNGWGIQNLKAEPFTAQALQFAPALIDLIRTVSNATEVITGEMVSKDLSGYAIAQLQAQAQKPIEMQRKRFWQHKEREGKILEMFFKLYYEEKQFSFNLGLEERMEEMQTTGVLPNDKGMDYFNGEEYQDTSFNIIVEAGAGTQYSEIQAMSKLDQLLQMQLIDLETYTDLYPDSAMPFKAEMKEYIWKQQQTELAQLRQLAQEQAMQIEQMKMTNAEQEKDISSFAKELKNANNINAQLQNEFTRKLNELMGRTQGQAQPNTQATR